MITYLISAYSFTFAILGYCLAKTILDHRATNANAANEVTSKRVRGEDKKKK